jgi:hypothetical protein
LLFFSFLKVKLLGKKKASFALFMCFFKSEAARMSSARWAGRISSCAKKKVRQKIKSRPNVFRPLGRAAGRGIKKRQPAQCVRTH